jgi:DNA-binding GntR family transcriptional regulator
MELGAEAAIRRFGDLRPSVESHRRLLDAIADRDPARAAEIAGEIVGRNQEFVLGLYAFAQSADGTGA